MVIEVNGNVFGEIKARTSNLRKRELKLGGKLTIEGQGHWFHSVKTKYDGKLKYVEAWDRSNRAENGLYPARSQTDSNPMCSERDYWVLAVQ